MHGMQLATVSTVHIRNCVGDILIDNELILELPAEHECVESAIIHFLLPLQTVFLLRRKPID